MDERLSHGAPKKPMRARRASSHRARAWVATLLYRLTPTRRWAQFSLGSMFVVVTLFCIWLAIQTNCADKQREAVGAIAKVGGRVLYHGDPDPRTAPGRNHAQHESFLSKVVGKDFLHGVRMVDLSNTAVADADLLVLKQIPGLEELGLYGTRITGVGMAALCPLRLRTLDLGTSGVHDDWLRHLREQRALRMLSLSYTKISDAGLVHVGGMKGLRVLGLGNTRVTDAGMAHLSGLASLEILQLRSTRVTDAGLASLSGIPTLRTLVLFDTAVSDAAHAELLKMHALRELYIGTTKMTAPGVERLRKALPNCNVID